MATRRETSTQKLYLKQALRQACEEGGLRHGEMAPSLRQLADEYSVSRKVASQVLQELVSEGLFYTLPRVGTFVGQRTVRASEYYLYLNNDEDPRQDNRGFINDQMRAGFEERIAILGGAILTLRVSTATDWIQRGLLPPIAGVFNLAFSADEWRALFISSPEHPALQAPMVRFGNCLEAGQTHDIVSFDDFQGGFQVTEYLQKAGHQRIAFLALHSNDFEPDSHLSWSVEREQGWLNAMKQARFETEGLAFYPASNPDPFDWRQELEVAYEVSKQLLALKGVTAVVAANDSAAMGLLRSLQDNHVPAAYWPAIVGFDAVAESRDQLVTSAQLSWQQIGSNAAELLWQRHHGLLIGSPQHRKAGMRIITRMTSYSQWPQHATEVMLTH